MKVHKLLFYTLIFFISTQTFSQTPTLVKDITPSNGSTMFGGSGYSGRKFVMVGSTLFFVKGFNELWKTDGTEQGTVLVKSINSSIDGLTNISGTLYFSGNGYPTNYLWKSDGTTAGTVLVKTLSTCCISSRGMFDFNGICMFVLPNTNSNGYNDLWRSDGTDAGTYKVKELGSARFGENAFAVIGTTLYFSAADAATGVELWKTDGINSEMVKDIRVGSSSSSPNYLKNYNGTLLFQANDGSTGYELWKSDGTANGTVLLKDTNPGSSDGSPENFNIINDKVLFVAYDNTIGRELWTTDGTAANTQLLKNINTTPYYNSITVFPADNYMKKVGNQLFFVALDATNGTELWKSDGTANGTVLVKDIFPNNISNGPFDFSYLFASADKVYFRTRTDGINPDNLWQSDGTEAGTIQTSTLNPSLPFTLGVPVVDNQANNTIFFTAYSETTGIELWKTDGTSGGLGLVKDITTIPQSSEIQKLSSINGQTFFWANDIIHGKELWKTAGTNATTQLSNNFTQTSYSTEIGFNIEYQNQLYIQTNIGQIWRTDGIQPLSLFHTYPISGAYSGYPACVSNNILFFRMFQSGDGYELFKTEGTSVSLVKNINPNNRADSAPDNMVDINGTLFFAANDGTNGKELWKSDGTTAGTVMIKDITVGSASTSFSEMINLNGTAIFMTDSYSKIWRSDGTDAGTYLLYNANGNYMGNSPNAMVYFNGKVLFKGYDATNGYELWETDGTIAGTKMIKNIIAGSGGSYPSNFVVFNNVLYFSANGFWKTDGTEAGTIQISPSISLNNVIATPELLFFSNYSSSYGSELWQSDGTLTGTKLVADVNAGIFSSNPSNLHFHNNKLYFTADNGSSGTELFVFLPCTQNFNLTTADNYPNGTAIKKEANISITATNQVANGANVKYDAGKYVLLNAGFEANQGSIFKAYIDGCNNDEPAMPSNQIKSNTNIAVPILTDNFPTLNDFFVLNENQQLKNLYLSSKEAVVLYENDLLKNQNTQTIFQKSPPIPSYYIIEKGEKDGKKEYLLTVEIGEQKFNSTLVK